MPIINYKPTTASRRNMSVTDYSGLSKVAPEKSLLAPLSNKSGRNSYGRITVRHRSGGNRKKYRIIDFKLSRYATLDAQYEKEQSELTAEISALEKAVKRYEKHEKDADRFIALIDKLSLIHISTNLRMSASLWM